MTLNKSITAVVFAAFLFMLNACSGGQKANSEAKEEENLPEDIVELRADQIKLANIEFGAVEQRVMSRALKVNGLVSVSPQSMATVCMPMGGFVRATSVMPGKYGSQKGQLLATLENQEFVDIQLNYLEARNKLEFAEAEYNRHSELYKNDVYSTKNVQQVTSEYKSLKAQVKALEQKLLLIGINPAKLHER